MPSDWLSLWNVSIAKVPAVVLGERVNAELSYRYPCNTTLVIFVLGNFAMRRKLYGDAVVGAENIAMIDIAKEHGLSAKFTGSGGALVCMRSDGQGWYVHTYYSFM
jgi:hypothetical protein